MISKSIGSAARIVLGVIRLANGAVGLLAPTVITRQLGSEGANPPAEYALRLFGIRTVLIGLDLLRPSSPGHAHAVRVAPLIHASDTVSAAISGRSGLLPRRAANQIVTISAVNTLLAIVMVLAADRSARKVGKDGA